MELSIALGGGGAKGMAHLGVLRCLEEDGFQIKAIAGTSAGGIVAAFYAAGYAPQEIIDIFQSVDQSQLYGRQPGDGPSILGVAGLNKVFLERLGDRTFSDMRIPLAVTALDLYTCQELVLDKGSVVQALLATMAVPGIFPPVEWGGHQLVDGGIVDPVPVATARALDPRLPVVAVALYNPEPTPIHAGEPPAFLNQMPILRQIARLRLAQAFNIFIHSMDIGHRYIAEMRLKLEKPEVIIRPEVADIGLLDRVDIVDMAERGHKAAKQALPKVEKAVSWQQRMKRRLKTIIGEESKK